jgi:hypothetical protein
MVVQIEQSDPTREVRLMFIENEAGQFVPARERENALKIRAFNIVPGLVIHRDRWPAGQDPRVVIVAVERDSETEIVQAWSRIYDAEGGNRLITSVWGYNDDVSVVGVTIEPSDPGQTDFGTEL